MLCGVVLAATFTYMFAIPANNDYWRMEIWNRGGAAWTYDKDGHLGWKWMIDPIPDPRPAKRFVTPASETTLHAEQL